MLKVSLGGLRFAGIFNGQKLPCSKNSKFQILSIIGKLSRTMATKEDCLSVWRKADAVCFDVDSTLVKDEGLDELAAFCGAAKEVKEWTNKAMGGSVSFRHALEERLKIIKPSHSQVTAFRNSHEILFSKGIQDLVSLLHGRGTQVYLVSGGFRSIIEPMAEELNIPKQNIFANRLKFYYNGEYAGFDTEQPTSSSGGKQKVAEQLKKRFSNLVFVGDGITDLEACPPADCFIGYGGNVVREQVKAQAKWYVTDFQELIDALRTEES